MARPRMDSGEPTAHDRLVDAFWEIYQQTAFDRITVEQVCHRAGVNRSTFYRHFCDLSDLLDELEEASIPRDVPASIVGVAMSGGDVVGTGRQLLQANADRLMRMCVLLSGRGDPRFARKMKDVMLGAFLTPLGATPESLSKELRLQVEFVLSGLVGVLAYHGDMGTEVRPVETMEALIPLLGDHLLPLLLGELTHEMNQELGRPQVG